MMDPEVLERIAARRAELDGLEEQLVKQLSEVRAERDELAVAERVWQRMSEQLADERTEAGSPVVQVAGRAVRLVPDRAPGVAESALPAEYQRILTAVRQASGPVSTRQIGEVLGGDRGEGQAGAVAREAHEAGRPRLAAQTPRREVHHPRVTRPHSDGA
ncbi:hypothetical protein OG772_36165 [Streptomyces sp. NBC_01321]|uniref:hypothetical protein n=1 Tax=Streptomyces sp. NBC_01321 TaxID=2903825 RepID=UPI002E12DF74|nr:hypothetical protein OG772_36165 [Streptomyces sp. NBC_01321]